MCVCTYVRVSLFVCVNRMETERLTNMDWGIRLGFSLLILVEGPKRTEVHFPHLKGRGHWTEGLDEGPDLRL